MCKYISFTLLILTLSVTGAWGQSMALDGFTNYRGETQTMPDGNFHVDPGLVLPLPRENYDALLNAVSEYVNDGKLSEEDYDRFCTSLTECTPKNPFYHPVFPVNNDRSGGTNFFVTTDLKGSTVRSDALFSGYKVTMLNIWDTTCAACITEMPALEKFSHELEEKGGQLVGLIYTADDPEMEAEAKDIVDDLKLTFTNLLPTDEIKALFPVQSFPTTFFFNGKGELIGDPVMGARMDQYRTRVEEFLSER